MRQSEFFDIKMRNFFIVDMTLISLFGKIIYIIISIRNFS